MVGGDGAAVRIVRIRAVEGLGDANLSKAELARADLAGAALTNADFSYANIARANLSGATVAATNFTGAYTLLTRFDDSDLSGATGLTQEQINIACGNGGTILPEGLEPSGDWPCPVEED